MAGIIVASGAYALSPAEQVSAKRPIVGWKNYLTTENVSATSETTEDPVSNLGNPSTSWRWTSASTGLQYLTSLFGQERDIDWAGVCRHNWASTTTEITLQGLPFGGDANDDGDWVDLVDTHLLNDDGARMWRFTKTPLIGFRWKLDPAATAPYAAVARCGELTVLKGIPPGHTPIKFGDETEQRDLGNQGGDHLGVAIITRKRSGNIVQPGGWVTATGYLVGDGVAHAGSSYICLVAHTSGVFATDLAVSKWELIAAKGDTGATGAAGSNGTNGTNGTDGEDGVDGTDGVSFVWEGAYSGATAYAANDVVRDQSSSWIALQATTGNPPPTLPTTSNAYWELMAQKGQDGAGSGSVTSVALAAPTGLDVSGSPVTVSGTLTLAWTAGYQGYTTAEATKLAHISVTQAVDLDAIETRVNQLDAAVVLMGGWDASAGTFPGGGTAQAGASYIVTVAGTVDGVAFALNDRLLAIADNASATTFAANWLKLDYTDQVLSVDSATGAVTVGAIIAAATGKTTPVDADALALSDSAASNATKKLTWANLKATLKAYFDSLTTTFTNKRITPRVTSEASSATPTINTDNSDAHSITALAAAITSMTTNLSGTPTNFQKLIIRIKDNGTARAITWGASFEARGVALPTTTVISKVLTVGFIYDTVSAKWGCVASAQEA